MSASDQEPVQSPPDEATQEVINEIHAEAAAEVGASPGNEYGTLGRRFDRRAPFYLGFMATLGAACAYAVAVTVVAAGQILVLLGLAGVPPV